MAERLRTYVQAHLSATDASGQAWTTTVTGGTVQQVDGTDNLVLDAVLTPTSGTVGDFVLHYDAVIDKLAAHRVFVSGRYGHIRGVHDAGDAVVADHVGAGRALDRRRRRRRRRRPVGVSSLPCTSASSTFADGSDHLLFLLMLLLPAPLVAARQRWAPRRRPGQGRAAGRARRHRLRRRALDHAGARGARPGWTCPSSFVESGIALSVLVSAVHAIRPLVRSGEVLIAAGSGCSTASRSPPCSATSTSPAPGSSRPCSASTSASSSPSSLVVALVMPSLIVLSRTAAYEAVRIALAVSGAVLAAAWFAQRTDLVTGNPLEPAAQTLVDHPLALPAALAAIAVLSIMGRQRSGARDSDGAASVHTAGAQHPAPG